MEKITKQFLLDNKIVIYINSQTGQPEIWRYSKDCRNAKADWHELKPLKKVTKTKYGKDHVYYCIRPRINGKYVQMYVSRVVYAFLHGSIPEGLEIDHIDRNPANNKPSNLRAVTHYENMQNRTESYRDVSLRFWRLKKQLEGTL